MHSSLLHVIPRGLETADGHSSPCVHSSLQTPLSSVYTHSGKSIDLVIPILLPPGLYLPNLTPGKLCVYIFAFWSWELGYIVCLMPRPLGTRLWPPYIFISHVTTCMLFRSLDWSDGLWWEQWPCRSYSEAFSKKWKYETDNGTGIQLGWEGVNRLFSILYTYLHIKI